MFRDKNEDGIEEAEEGEQRKEGEEEQEEFNQPTYYYAWIKNLSRLVINYHKQKNRCICVVDVCLILEAHDHWTVIS